MDSLDCLAPLGMMVSFGNASGAVTQFNPGVLAQKGSLFLTRPTLFTYTAKREDLVRAARLVRGGEEQSGQNLDQSNVSIARSGAGAQRSRGPQNHRLDDTVALIGPINSDLMENPFALSPSTSCPFVLSVVHSKGNPVRRPAPM